jgi:lysophospholipase L1-like esterase
VTIYYTSNDASIGFDATSAGSVPTDWAAKVGTWQVGTVNPTGAHTHTFGSTTHGDGDVALNTGISAVADMSLLYAQQIPTGTWAGTSSPNISIVLRSDSGNANNYTIVLSNTGTAGQAKYIAFKKVSGGFSVINNAGALAGNAAGATTWSPGTTMWIRAQVQGTTISLRAWHAGSSEPSTWDLSFTDSSISAAGYAGFYYSLDTGSAIAMGVDEVQVQSIGAEALGVTTPGTQTAGVAMTVSGTYTNGPPSSLAYEFDGGSWTTASSPTISGGTWSFSVTAPAAGSHTVGVRDPSDTTTAVISGSFTTTASETIAVNNPGSQTAGAPMTVTGTYANGTPTALDVEFDSAGWSAASSPTISGGTFSFSVTAPAAGSHTVSVRDHANTSASGTSSSFTVSSAATISVTTPGPQIAGQSMTVSGSYTGTAPTGINYEFDSSGYVAASSPTIGGGTWSFTVTAPAFGSHTISVQEANSTSTTATSGSFNVNVAPNNAAIAYSPYTWNVTGAAASTIDAGAYFRTLFSGASCTLNFNVANMATPASEIWWRIDDGPWTEAAVAATVALSIPSTTASNADVPYHLLEVVVKSTTQTANRWNSVGSATGTAVIFTGLTLASGAAVVAPLTAPLDILCFGDSITEGVRALGESAANDTDQNDALLSWAYRLGQLLGAEVGLVGFGSLGLSVTGSGNVPILGSSYSLLYAGQARSFSPTPNLVVINIGTNDSTTNTVAAMTGLLNGLISACPGTPIAVLRPFNGNQAANLQSAITACNAPTQCHWIDTTGFFSTTYGSDSLNLHPSGPNGVGRIAPQVAAVLRPLVAGSTAKSFRGGFQRGLLG